MNKKCGIFSLLLILEVIDGNNFFDKTPVVSTKSRDDLESSQIAVTTSVDFKKLRASFYQQREIYRNFYGGSFSDFLKIDSLHAHENLEEKKLVVSLTSWPPRIETLFITIQSILCQKKKPDVVVVYLSEKDFPDKRVPETLRFLQTKGLEVRWVKENLKSHKKLLYALKEFPKSTIVTIDDDNYYYPDFLEILTETSDKFPNSVVGLLGKTINSRAYSNRLLCTKDYKNINKRKNVFDIVSSEKFLEQDFVRLYGGSGILYPAYTFSETIFDTDFIKKYCRSDDVWFFSCSLKTSSIVTIFNKRSQALKDFAEKRTYENTKEIKNGATLMEVCQHNAFLYLGLYKKLNLKPIEYLENTGLVDIEHLF